MVYIVCIISSGGVGSVSHMKKAEDALRRSIAKGRLAQTLVSLRELRTKHQYI